jgi:hypothetical protein
MQKIVHFVKINNCTVLAKNQCDFGFCQRRNDKAKSGYEYGAYGRNFAPVYQWIGLEKLCIDLVSAEFIAHAIYSFL